MTPRLTRRDVYASLITGLIAGLIAWRIIEFSFPVCPAGSGCSTLPLTIAPFLVVLLPLLWIMGVWLGYILSRWFSFFAQFGKFCVIGFTNFAVDAGVLNLLIWITGRAQGPHYSLFVALSFLVAVSHSFFWNKYWAFNAANSPVTRAELFKFVLVMLVSLVVKVIVASTVVNGISPQFGINVTTWATVGDIVGSAAALLFSFFGFRLIVFK